MRKIAIPIAISILACCCLVAAIFYNNSIFLKSPYSNDEVLSQGLRDQIIRSNRGKYFDLSVSSGASKVAYLKPYGDHNKIEIFDAINNKKTVVEFNIKDIIFDQVEFGVDGNTLMLHANYFENTQQPNLYILNLANYKYKIINFEYPVNSSFVYESPEKYFFLSSTYKIESKMYNQPWNKGDANYSENFLLKSHRNFYLKDGERILKDKVYVDPDIDCNDYHINISRYGGFYVSRGILDGQAFSKKAYGTFMGKFKNIELKSVSDCGEMGINHCKIALYLRNLKSQCFLSFAEHSGDVVYKDSGDFCILRGDLLRRCIGTFPGILFNSKSLSSDGKRFYLFDANHKGDLMYIGLFNEDILHPSIKGIRVNGVKYHMAELESD